ncbi:hypothetical protein MOP88_07280 [Sphingomonas sp. WKB10]|nr:hypothetical protein [Sphingomonas sp. WKB10]
MSTLVTRIGDLTTRIATEIKLIKTTVGSTSSLNTTAKNSLVAALNEVLALANQAVSAAGATIDDTATASTTKTYSVSKIVDLVNSAVNQLTNGAPGALDTLDELAAALGDDANFAATVTAALGNRVRVDAAQTLTTAQKAQAKANIDALGTAEIGDPDTNFVTTFNAGLA